MVCMFFIYEHIFLNEPKFQEMKSLHELSSKLNGKILMPNQLNNIKGGTNSASNSASAGASNAADDDKRRERPGGGISN